MLLRVEEDEKGGNELLEYWDYHCVSCNITIEEWEDAYVWPTEKQKEKVRDRDKQKTRVLQTKRN